MSLNLSDLRKNERTITVEIGSQSFDVTYRPFAMTPEREAELDSLEDSPGEWFLQFFCDVVSDWDVRTSDKGKKVPITPDGLQQVPSGVLRSVMNAVGEDRRVDPPSGGTSEDS